MKVLIVRLSSFGDIIHGFPVAAALREAFPRGTIDWLVEARFSQTAALSSSIDSTIPVRFGVTGGGASLRTTVRSLRAARYDATLDLQGLWKSAFLSRLMGARKTVGFDHSGVREPGASWFYNRKIGPGPFGHVVEKNLGLLRALDINTDKVSFPLRLPPSSAGASLRGDYGLIHPGSSVRNKMWPVERFAALVSRLRDELAFEFGIVVGPDEGALADRIVHLTGEKSLKVFHTLNPADLTRLIADARIFVGCDSGPIHLAAALGTPVVALHGPTDPARNGPWRQSDFVVSRFNDCSCRYRRRCIRPVPCIQTITVEEVLAVARTRLLQSP